jgi:hypothetical protein
LSSLLKYLIFLYNVSFMSFIFYILIFYTRITHFNALYNGMKVVSLREKKFRSNIYSRKSIIYLHLIYSRKWIIWYLIRFSYEIEFPLNNGLYIWLMLQSTDNCFWQIGYTFVLNFLSKHTYNRISGFLTSFSTDWILIPSYK